MKSKKVSFIIAGAQKSGTTALERYMREHPYISMAKEKEVHYFDNEAFFVESPNYLDYHQNFDFTDEAKLYGEATPIYMYWYDAPKRVWQYNPKMKFIIILRNPIERAYSHWNMERDRGAESLSFGEALQREQERCREALPLQHRTYSYVDRGFYTHQLKRVLHFFPREQLLCLKNEDLKKSPNEVLLKIARFLEIEDFPQVKAKDIHSREYISTISQEQKTRLQDIFFYEIKALEKMLEWDCSQWLD